MGLQRRFGVIPLVFVIVFCILEAVDSQDDRTRNRGNTVRNELVAESGPHTVNILATRTEGIGEGRRLHSTFSTLGIPSLSVQRWDRKLDQLAGISIRVGLVSLVEYEESANGQDGLDPSDLLLNTYPLWTDPSSTDSGWKKLEETADVEDDAFYYFYNTYLPVPRRALKNTVNLNAGIADLRGWIGVLNRTVAPDAWKWGFNLFNVPVRSKDSRLALKCVVDSDDPAPVYRPNLPPIERDEPATPMAEFSFVSPRRGSFSAEDATDKSYFAWAVQGSEIGGIPEPNAKIINTITRLRTMRVINSPLLSPNEDFDPESEMSIFLSEFQNPRFVYFSFMVSMPKIIHWDPFVGIDELDRNVAEASGSVQNTTSWPCTVLYLICLLLVQLVK